MDEQLKQVLRSVLQEELKPISESVQCLEQDVRELKQGQERLESRMDSLESKVSNIDLKLDNFMSETRSHFKHLEDKLDGHENVLKAINKEVSGMRIDVDYLITKTGKHDAEINKLKQQLNS